MLSMAGDKATGTECGRALEYIMCLQVVILIVFLLSPFIK